MKRPLFNRGHIAFLHDLAMAALSFPIALYLRLGDDIFAYGDAALLRGTPLFAAVAGTVFWSMRLYRGIWRYASLTDLTAIAKASTAAVLIFLPLMFLVTRLEGVPRSVMVINWLLLLILLGGPRVLYRLIKDRRLPARLSSGADRRVPVLLVGAGDGAETFIRAIARDPDANYRVVGLVDDKPHRIGLNIHGHDVLGGVGDIATVVEGLTLQGNRPQRMILTRDRLDGAQVRNLLDQTDKLGLTLSRLPKLTDFEAGVGGRLETRPIAIEDLLGRPQAVLDRDAMRALIAGRRVMVTGAGGSIGTELVRQIATYGPAHLALLDSSEYNLYRVDRELTEAHPAIASSAILADIRNAGRIQGIFNATRPELVFHAAALKHVPMVEENPDEGILTNVAGTRNVADACRAARVTAMVLISTDKAVNPANVMGASKRLAESYCQSLDVVDENGGTRFVTVRFGNVLGSTGSVVPLFQRQLAAGGPLTVTHADVIRYFMTAREAVELVLQATAIGRATEDGGGKIMVLDMGEPVRILDLAHQMIRLAGLRPDIDIGIEFIGLRPGEKLFEELFHGSEPTVATAHDGILLAAPRAADHAVLARAIDDLAAAAAAGQTERALGLLRSLVPEYGGESSAASAASS